MPQKITKTAYPPRSKPVMIWDGDCPFCQFWIEFLHRFTGDRVEYAPYQEAVSQYGDIPLETFEEAVQFIETNGNVYNGLQAAYRSFIYLDTPIFFLQRWYKASATFAMVSDHLYHFISRRRPFMYKLTVATFGRNPKKLKPYGLVSLGAIFLLVFYFNKRQRGI